MQNWRMKLIPWKEILVVAILSVYSIAFGCPETHINVQGIIESRDYYRGAYPNDFGCKYTIKANHGNKILLEFDEFDLEPSNGCTKDYLAFQETGIASKKRCGSDKRPYFSQTNKVILYFRSDSSGTRKGFRIRYRTCGGEYEDSYKYHITSPSYGLSEYPNGTDCSYKMTSINDFGFRLVFNVFSLENSTYCTNDSFSIYDGASSSSSLMEKRCGKERGDLVTKSSQITARFLTNSHISDIGFNVSVYACYRLMTTDRSTIASPNYPSGCDNNVFCLYDIRLPAGSKLKLEFRHIIHVGNDHLKLKNNSKSTNAIFVNGSDVSDVESREYANELYLELKCDYVFGINNGFQMFYYDNQGACSKFKPCQNGGNCTDISTKNHTYDCSCTLDYEGKNCTKKISPCASSPCLNSGTCEDIPSRNNIPPTFKCTCVGDYTGQRCESLIGGCEKNRPCQNGGQCTDIDVNAKTYTCTCPLDYKGVNCEHFIDGCKEYRNDSRWQRSTGFNDSTTFCDGSLQVSWYRFATNAGSDMPTTCPDKNSCGTAGSIWMNGTVHLQVGNETDMTVCARNSTSCCSASWDIRIKKCQVFNGTTFTVYRLLKPPSCPMAYCAGTELPCPTNYNSVNGFTPNCTEIHPQIPENPRFYPEVEGNRLVFKCEFKSNTKEDVARFQVTWYEESPLRQIGKVDILKGTERVAKLQKFLNSSNGTPLFRLGKTMFCKVFSWYEGRPYGRINGTLKESNHFFAGIKIEPNLKHYTMRVISKPLQFTVTVTVPIVCSLSNDCSVIIHITQDNSEVYLNLCSMKFKNGSYRQVFEIAVKRDFVYRNKQTIVKLEVEDLKDPVDFINHHEIRDIVITINELINSYGCASYTDPYIRPFRSSGYWQSTAGNFILVQSKTRAFEVQSRTYYCGRGISGTCNCGVAAREGNDVVVVDFCSGGPMSARFASQREPAFGTSVNMDSTGRSFSINFPSGARVHANFHSNSISISIPAEDYSTTIGDCHSAGHRVNGTSLFGYCDNVKTCRDELKKHYCICQGNSSLGYKEDCSIKSLIDRKDYYQTRGKSILLIHPTVKACNRKETKEHIVVPTCFIDDIYRPNTTPRPGPAPTWPTPTGKTKSNAKNICENAIRNSAVGRACTVIPNFRFQEYVDQCVENVKLTDTYDFTLATVEALQGECGETLFGNDTHWEERNGARRPPQNFTNTLCPNLCSGHGTCQDSICTCNENFTAIDCSIDKRKGPTLLSIRKGNICDMRTRSDCHLVRIMGSNFMVAVNSACRTTKLKVAAGGHTPTSVQNLHQVSLLSFAEVLCTTSPTSTSHVAYSVDVTNDGSIFSSNQLKYVIYDSNCLNCSQSSSFPTVCSIKKNTCNIGGNCYSLGEASKSDPYAICNPDFNQTAFTKEHFPKIKTGPRLSLVIKNKRIGFNCEFETEKDEERARFEVTWYEGSPLKKINKTHILKGRDRNATLQNDISFSEGLLFSLGTSVFCRVRSWYINTTVSHIPGPYHESNHYYAGIKVEPNKQVHILSESDKALKLNISTTVPIICSASHSCRVLVEISTDNSEALLDICVLEFKPGLANQSKIVQIAAKKDFILDGSNLMKLKFNISLKYDPVDWDRHRLIPDVLIKVTDGDTKRCQSSGDPHLITYDGLYFDHYKVGTYLLTKSNCRKFEVHVRTHKCSTVSCNCGVAACEGNDVIVIDFCKGAVQTAWFASKGVPANGTKLMRDRTGKNFEIKFPSGSFVRFNVYGYAGTHYANVLVQAPSDDFRCTSGLCGSFDGDQRNDMKERSGKIHDFMQRHPASVAFTESYRVNPSEDLFMYTGTSGKFEPPKPFCSCLSNSSGYFKVNCNYESSQTGYIGSKEGWVQLIPPNAHIARKQNTKTEVVLPLNENPIYTHKPEEPSGIIPKWPTKSGRTKLEVEAYCNDKIRNSTSGKICAIIPNFPFHLYSQQCVTDIQVTDTDAFTISAIQSMQFACEEIFLKNMSFWKPGLDKNGTPKPPTDLEKEMCPGLCSGNGVCANSTCKCNDQYTSDDCSVDKKTPPKIESVGVDGLCDVRQRSDCHIIRIKGSGFFENDNLACRTTKLKISQEKSILTDDKRKYKAKLLSFKEILCDIGSHAVGTNQLSDRYPNDGYVIEVTNDGGIFSKADASYIIYDSKCMKCDGKYPSCKQKDKTCIIAGQCNIYGETNGKYKCNTESKIGASTAKPSSERNILIAVGCFVGFVLLLAILSLVGIRRKQIEDREKSKIGNEDEGEFELGRINLSIFSEYEGLGGEKHLKEEVLKGSLNEEDDKVLQLKGEPVYEEIDSECFYVNIPGVLEEEREDITKCQPNETIVDEEHLSAAALGTDDGEKALIKEAEIVIQSDVADGTCAEVPKVEQVDTTASLNKDELFESEEVIRNDEADEKIVEPHSDGLTANDTEINPDDESECCYTNLSGGEDYLKAAIDNPSYEENEA